MVYFKYLCVIVDLCGTRKIKAVPLQSKAYIRNTGVTVGH